MRGYTDTYITEMPIDKARARNEALVAEASEISMMRGVLGT